MDIKKALGRHAAYLVEKDSLVGLGSGTTAEAFIEALGERVKKEGLSIRGIPTSVRTEEVARQNGIPIVFHGSIDIAFDGADEVDKKRNLIKGGGGAMLREKIVNYAAKEFVCLIGGEKLVDAFRRAIPCEILPFALPYVQDELARLGEPVLRMRGKEAFLTDNGNYIIDLKTKVEDPVKMENALNKIPGVLGNGIFTRPCRIMVGDEGGNISEF